ncbi:MAG: hypothetical protein AB8B72_10835 [Crocinitomicaceae bacterium]
MKVKLLNVISVLVIGLLLYSFCDGKSLKVTKNNLYKVIRVNGKILFVKTGQGLKTGDSYIDGTPLSFASNRDRAAIINKIKGRYILQPNQKGKAIVLQATSNVDARTGSALLNLLDVKNYFSDSIVLIGDVRVTMGKEAFPLNEDNFFYVTYMYNNEKIAKKLLYEGQELLMSESKLFEVDGKPIPTLNTEMTLYYMQEDMPKKMSTFYPVFPNSKGLEREVSVLLEGLGEIPTDKKLDEIASYITGFYGKTQKENLNDWLLKTFDLGIEKETNFK